MNITINTLVTNASAFLFELDGNMTFSANSAYILIDIESSLCYNVSYSYGVVLAGNILMNKSLS